MIGVRARTHDNVRKVARRSRQANIKSLGHAGASIRMVARRSIRRRKSASAEGKPPHTRKGQLRSAIFYSVEQNRDQVVIGPDHGKVGRSASAHEFGGRYRRQRYPRRPFMGPAFEKTKDRLPRLWAGSVKG